MSNERESKVEGLAMRNFEMIHTITELTAKINRLNAALWITDQNYKKIAYERGQRMEAMRNGMLIMPVIRYANGWRKYLELEPEAEKWFDENGKVVSGKRL